VVLLLTAAFRIASGIPSSSWIVIVRHDVVLLLAFDSRSNVLECDSKNTERMVQNDDGNPSARVNKVNARSSNTSE
jgi:hypothetical protein